MIAEALLVTTLLSAPVEWPPLPWFGEDKLLHFVASFAVSSLAASGARAAGLDHDESILVGAGVGAAGGLIKEIQDSRLGGPFSGYDLVWDAAGVGSAVLLIEAGR
jgi:uncharacterized protein YfiM (DUF2279 family)